MNQSEPLQGNQEPCEPVRTPIWGGIVRCNRCVRQGGVTEAWDQNGPRVAGQRFRAQKTPHNTSSDLALASCPVAERYIR